ncbi:MAG TPA: PAS domain S-box protein [Gemmatimonadaceae bacterium]|nr:PAS domain S-box protein [Gemmatimonadaceae bacterium]
MADKPKRSTSSSRTPPNDAPSASPPSPKNYSGDEGAGTKSGIAAEIGDLHRLLVESVQDYAIFALDPAGYILSWNAGAERFKGYKAEEIIGKHFSIFYPRDLVEQGFPQFELLTAANTGRFEDEGWRIRKDGSRFWANVVITALRDRNGKLLGFGKVTRDLTERREAEEALRESEERFRLMVEGVKDYAIFLLDPTGLVTTWNDGAERINGYRAKEIIGQHFSKFYPQVDKDARKPARELEIATRTGKYEEEGWRVRKDGSMFWASVLITAIRNRAGELIGFAKVTRDLTERHASEQRALDDARRVATEQGARLAAEARAAELREVTDRLKRQTEELEARTREAEEARHRADDARRRADEANRVKSQFLAAMSHELRTPLNAIGGYADLINMGLSGPVTARQKDQLERIKRSQAHLLGIINDILNFSRIEAGQLSYDLAAVPIQEVVSSVTHMISPQALAKGIAFVDAGCDEGLTAWADRAKVEQIVLNLLSNAVKFTPSGGTITLSCILDAAQRVSISVRDTGIGISNEQIETIFEPFVQVGRTLTASAEGTGLGLAISRDLARAMGGDIVVTSTPDVGSEFTVTLPALHATKAP